MNTTAKLRDALLQARRVIAKAGGYWAEQTLPIIDDALLASPRNCDRFDGDIDKLREACLRERGLNPEEDFPDVFPEWLLAPIDASLVERDNVSRPATELEVYSGEAVWCAACATDCPDVGRDVLMKCGRFRETKK